MRTATPCSNCNQPGNPATVHCLDCKESLCETCHDSHDALKSMKRHKIVSLEEMDSGKAAMPSPQEQTCGEHESETKRFYCETCETAICRDCILLSHREHRYLSLKEVSKKRGARLTELMQECEVLRKACGDAVQKTETIEEELESGVEVAKEKLATIISGYKDELDAILEKHEAELDTVQTERAKELHRVKDNLKTKLDTITNACDLSAKVTQTGSEYEIASMYPTLSATMEQLNKIDTPVAADECLGYVAVEVIKMPDLAGVVGVLTGETWKKTVQFTTIEEKLCHPCGVIVHPDGDITLTKAGFGKQYAHVFYNAGGVKHTFKGTFEAQLYDITLTHDNRYILPGKAEILWYDREGNPLKSSIAATTHDVNNKPSNPLTLAVDSTGKIVAGLHGNTISIHHGDGQFISRFATHATPRCLAVTSQDQIAISFADKSLRIMDYTGNTVRVVQRPRGIQYWNPGYICCSKRGEIFVVTRGDPTSVYRFTADGDQCLGCVATGLSASWGIALTEDGQKLYVTEWSKHRVTVFERK